MAYFGDESIAKVLLKKNEEIIRLGGGKQVLVVNETPVVSKENLMDAIVSKYKGNVVVVDFWATWCIPCLKGINENRIIKNEMKDKNVVFVYIAGASSPQRLWKEKIEGIGGEHYYLTKEEWDYLLDGFDFTGIPTYLFYDTNGVLKHKTTGYPGTEKMKTMIEEIL